MKLELKTCILIIQLVLEVSERNRFKRQIKSGFFFIFCLILAIFDDSSKFWSIFVISNYAKNLAKNEEMPWSTFLKPFPSWNLQNPKSIFWVPDLAQLLMVLSVYVCFFSYFLLQADFDYWDPFKSEYWNVVSYIYHCPCTYFDSTRLSIVLVRVMKLQILYLLLLLLFVKHSAD